MGTRPHPARPRAQPVGGGAEPHARVVDGEELPVRPLQPLLQLQGPLELPGRRRHVGVRGEGSATGPCQGGLGIVQHLHGVQLGAERGQQGQVVGGKLGLYQGPVQQGGEHVRQLEREETRSLLGLPVPLAPGPCAWLRAAPAAQEMGCEDLNSRGNSGEICQFQGTGEFLVFSQKPFCAVDLPMWR